MNGVLPLIAPTDLARKLNGAPSGPAPVLLDVRWRLAGPPALPDYQRAHLPGAVFVNLDTDLADPPGAAGRHPVPDANRLAARFASFGISDDSTVVAYDDADGSVAARAWWLLRWLGLPAERVAVLDGGYAAWQTAGLPTSQDVPEPRPGTFTARPGSMPVLDMDGAGATAGAGVLLDARAPARYRGETEPIDPRPGHIPGARNAPFALHVGPDGRWRPPEELAEHYRSLGVHRLAQSDGDNAADSAEAEVGAGAGGGVGAYCGSGVTATSVILALEYAGLRPPSRPAALYPGSWSQWSADPTRPAATGPEPTEGAPR
jgi:thiosulfate/3-mercaptopyruvate sulfurtransferase